MPVEGPGPIQLRDLSLRLREMGGEGKGLQRELYRAIRESAKPLARQVVSPAWLYPYMPDRYATELAPDLKVTAATRGGEQASVLIRLRGGTRDRQVRLLNAGLLRHPVFARRGTPRKTWNWKTQTGGMRPGFFSDAVRGQIPAIRDEVQQAMHGVAQKITS